MTGSIYKVGIGLVPVSGGPISAGNTAVSTGTGFRYTRLHGQQEAGEETDRVPRMRILGNRPHHLRVSIARDRGEGQTGRARARGLLYHGRRQRSQMGLPELPRGVRRDETAQEYEVDGGAAGRRARI